MRLKKNIYGFFKHYILFGVDTPKIDIPFFITIDKLCNRTNLDVFCSLLLETNLNSLLSLPKFQYE